MARFVAGGGYAVVVTAKGRKAFSLTGTHPIVSPNPNKWTVSTTEGELTVVASGGCLCGKPWMREPNDPMLLAWAEGKLGVDITVEVSEEVTV